MAIKLTNETYKKKKKIKSHSTVYLKRIQIEYTERSMEESSRLVTFEDKSYDFHIPGMLYGVVFGKRICAMKYLLHLNSEMKAQSW